MMSFRLVTPATFEPVSLAEAKRHLKIDHAYDDDYITSLITVARIAVETYTQAAAVKQSFRITESEALSTIELPFSNPLISVESVGYYEGEQYNVLESFSINTEAVPGRVALGGIYSDAQIEYTCGPATISDVKPVVKHAVLLTLTWLYENREGDNADELPKAAKYLLIPERILGPIPVLVRE